ncbi:defective proboscis extension response 1 isoform 2-T3 [Cochliomyia hominivorax]
MCKNSQVKPEKCYHETYRASPLTLLRPLYLGQHLQENNLNHYHAPQQFNSNQQQNYREKDFFPRCSLIFLILLSLIEESLTTMHSTPYSLDFTTVVTSTNLLPYFDFDVPRNITVTNGQTGFLHCRVERLGDKDVSWIRKRDLHILTAGSTTYTSDQRFQVLRPENSGNWTLQIKYPQPRDSGIYECQINTEPKMSLSYVLNVIELKASIIGPTDLYVKSGSDINLTCKIIQGPHELGNIFWYKGSDIIDMTTNQNDIDSGTRITVENDWSDGLTSRLKIRGASSSDTGNYTCVPTIAKSSSVYVHIIIGEHPAAMQHNSSNMHCSNFHISLCCMLFTVLSCCLQHLMCTDNVKGGKTENKVTTFTIKKVSISRVLSLTISSGTTTSTSISVPTSALIERRKVKIWNLFRIPGVARIAQPEQYISSFPLLTLFSLSAFLFINKKTTTIEAEKWLIRFFQKLKFIEKNIFEVP